MRLIARLKHNIFIFLLFVACFVVSNSKLPPIGHSLRSAIEYVIRFEAKAKLKGYVAGNGEAD